MGWGGYTLEETMLDGEGSDDGLDWTEGFKEGLFVCCEEAMGCSTDDVSENHFQRMSEGN
jgi:hypothetical protein